jgi:alpha-mannosidase
VESPVYSEPITLSSSAVVKAAVVQDGGGLGPVSGARIDVRDVTPPRVDRVQPMFETARIRIALSEPVENVTASQFQIEAVQAAEGTLVPKVEGATLSENKRSVELVLNMPPVTGTKYVVRIAGLKDASPQGNTSVARALEFMIDGPVYELKALEANARDITIADVPGMPLLAKDPWTLNMFVKMDKQPLNRTVLAGFGSMADQGGKGRYLAKFSGGIHFWSSNRDVPSKTDFDLDRWQMITITFDGSVTRVYKDGVEIAYGLTSLSDDDNVIHILPADPWEKLRHFDGQLRDISIWKSAMTADGVNALLKRDVAR